MSENNTNVPKIRFPGFTDAWEQRKLGEELSLLKDGTHGTHKDVGNGPYLLSAKNIKNGEIRITENDRKISQEEYGQIHKSFQLKTGDVLLTIVGSIGEAAVLHNPVGITFQRSVAYLRPSEIDSNFLYTLVTSHEFQKQLKNRQVVTAQPGIYLGDLAKIDIIIPRQKEEQKYISLFFSHLDNLITLHQRKLNHLQDEKKSLLQKMFPKDGADIPEIRFPGFTDFWEQRKMGELAGFSKGSGYSKGDLIENGHPIILYGRLYVNYETVINEVDSFVELKDKSVISQGNEVIVPSSGETPEDISRASAVGKAGIILGGDLNIIKPSSEIDPVFLALTISNGEPQKEMSKRAQGKSVVHLHNSDLKQVNLFYPRLEEQRMIGQFFGKLDNLITLHQLKLEHLQEQKNALLQQMFV